MPETGFAPQSLPWRNWTTANVISSARDCKRAIGLVSEGVGLLKDGMEISVKETE